MKAWNPVVLQGSATSLKIQKTRPINTLNGLPIEAECRNSTIFSVHFEHHDLNL